MLVALESSHAAREVITARVQMLLPKSADKPGSVPSSTDVIEGGDHLSRMMVAHHL